ncbi:putative PpiC-type peptidyl-prolyl cis-trans isomerase [Magnetofaba australis IT-1]|uniref:Periplasmic chaperone PpiD n=2 Tax=Magnetofaba TaxID=1472292 RepID=A0A1Y2K6F4_9PROT|nr:putative PpiC-type peptidyl-prolyl cis-trans isomerase [Magnetofaba australis IT-1]
MTLRREIEAQTRQLRERSGGMIPAQALESRARMIALRNTIERGLMLALANDLRLAISPDALQEHIANTPAFQVDGRFDPTQYKAALRSFGMTPKSYESSTLEALMLDQLQSALTTAIHTPDLLLDDLEALTLEKRQIALLTIDPDAMEPPSAPDDKSLEAFYKSHQAQYMTPVRVKLAYTLIDEHSVRDDITVTDDEIAAYYEENMPAFKTPETRHVRHILVKLDKENPNAEADASAKAQVLRERILAGESFETVAKESSEDITAQQGGDLGVIRRGMMVKAFDEAAFSLEQGAVSDVVVTPFGVHLIKVDAIVHESVKPLEKSRAEIREKLIADKAIEKVYQRSIDLEDRAATSDDLAAIAKDLNLRFKETDYLSMNDDKAEQIERQAKFVAAAFNTATGALSPVTEVDEGKFFILKVLDRKEPEPKPLADIRDEVSQAYMAQQNEQSATELLTGVKQALSEGKSWDEATANLPKGAHVTTPAPFLMTDLKSDVSAAARRAAFQTSLKSPLHAEIVRDAGKLNLVYLTKVLPVEEKDRLPEAQRTAMRRQLSAILGQEQYEDLLRDLHERAEVRVNEALMKQL